MNRSKCYIVLLEEGEARFKVHYLSRVIRVGDGGQMTKTLTHLSKRVTGLSKSQLLDMFQPTGLTTRFYEKEEKQWMDFSTEGGVKVAPGNRDGSWGIPSVEEFERDYLGR